MAILVGFLYLEFQGLEAYKESNMTEAQLTQKDLAEQREAALTKMALYRFFMGENLTPIPKPIRREVVNTASVPVDSCFVGDVDAFFERMKCALKRALHDKGIEMGDLQLIDIESSHDGSSCFEVSYLAPESDSELLKRQRKADVFKTLLTHQNELYTHIDGKLSCSLSKSLHL